MHDIDDHDDFRTLFDFLPIGAYRSTPEGRMLRSNPALVRLNGCDNEAEHHSLVHDIASEWYVDPGRRAEFKRLLEQQGRVIGFVSEIRRQKTRERIWIRENAHVLRHPDGRVRCYEGTVEEITAEVQAQQRLAASQQELARIVDLLPGVVYKTLWTAAGGPRQVVFVSAKLKELFGIDPHVLTSRPDAVLDLRHPDDAARVAQAVRDAWVSGSTLDVVYRALRPDGLPCWVRMISVAAPDEEGRKVRVGMLFDVTAQQQANQALREQGDLWKRAMESTGDAVWDWDLETGVEVMSGNVAELYGYGPGELLPSPDTMDALTHPDDAPAMRRAREEHFTQRTRVYLNEHRILCKNGQWKWVLSRGMVIRRDADGRPLRMIGTHTDIDAVKRAEALQRDRDRAAAADRAKSEFLSRVSHELRTPLNAVLGFSQLLARPDAGLQETQASWVGHILASGRHLLALVDDVLDLSAMQSGHFRLTPARTDLRQVLAEVLALAVHDAATADVRLPGPAELAALDRVVAWADRTRCRQVIANLVSNAIKYNRQGGKCGCGCGSRVVMPSSRCTTTGQAFPRPSARCCSSHSSACRRPGARSRALASGSPSAASSRWPWAGCFDACPRPVPAPASNCACRLRRRRTRERVLRTQRRLYPAVLRAGPPARGPRADDPGTTRTGATTGRHRATAVVRRGGGHHGCGDECVERDFDESS